MYKCSILKEFPMTIAYQTMVTMGDHVILYGGRTDVSGLFGRFNSNSNLCSEIFIYGNYNINKINKKLKNMKKIKNKN